MGVSDRFPASLIADVLVGRAAVLRNHLRGWRRGVIAVAVAVFVVREGGGGSRLEVSVDYEVEFGWWVRKRGFALEGGRRKL